MKRTQHPTNNAVLGAPPGIGIENCTALPITRVVFQDGDQACVSFWSPSAEELTLLNSGRSVRLCALGTTHAPLSIGVDGDEVML